jgi:hypothetical protein
MLRASQQKTMAKRIGGGIGTFEFQSLPAQKEDPLRESCIWEDPKEFLCEPDFHRNLKYGLS